MKKTGFALAAFAIATTSNAAPLEIRGVPSCGQWINSAPSQRAAYEYWLIGYLSGVAVGKEKNFLSGNDNADFTLWMDNWCRANPLENVASGAADLYRELVKRKGMKP